MQTKKSKRQVHKIKTNNNKIQKRKPKNKIANVVDSI